MSDSIELLRILEGVDDDDEFQESDSIIEEDLEVSKCMQILNKLNFISVIILILYQTLYILLYRLTIVFDFDLI